MNVEKILAPIILIPLVVIILLTATSTVDDSSSDTESDTITVTAYNTEFTLTEDYIETGSETVTNVTGDTLTKDTDYTIDYTNGRITFLG